MTLNAMIVDDEPFVRKDLAQMLAVHPEINVLFEVGTIAAAKKHLSGSDLDVVFLDIQLRGGTGFDIVPFIDPSAKIIFITAHDDYAIRAFEVNALDYMLKPVTAGRLAQSIKRLTTGKKKEREKAAQTGPFQLEDSVFIRSESVQMFVCLKDIVTISSIGGNYVAIHLDDGQKVVCRKTFKELETILPEAYFLRVHRSAIINITYIECIRHETNGACKIQLSGQEHPRSVSRRMAPRLKALAASFTN